MCSYLHTVTQHQAYVEKTVTIEQKDSETHIDHAPACVHCVQKKGCSHCIFPSIIPIPRLKRVNLSTRLWHYLANSSFSNMIDHKATKVLYSYLPNCLPDKTILLKLLSHSEKGLLKTIKSKHTKIMNLERGVGIDNCLKSKETRWKSCTCQHYLIYQDFILILAYLTAKIKIRV